ncbi:YchJ family protein [Shewanella sp. JM162201]|uniref:YchJ family protein n=1 Tax=Shewanella jiangmenensis TaxID=2837387 RepID=A0ABS5V8E7_9GAMM|nr:YchJ family protein [Shewanella jiangmenensis]MBT1445936.1 YchJ family protein [Shewanella jiangmenensis]
MTTAPSPNAAANPICPCQSTGGVKTLDYQHCCEPFHLGQQIPQTPEQLMRSRYSAFVLRLWDYLIATHHPDYLNGLTTELLQQGPHPAWLTLEVHESSMQGDRGEVFFSAWYKDSGKLDAICERSAFLRENGAWFYTEGRHSKPKLPGRNDSCICGSGKKFKQCCQRG